MIWRAPPPQYEPVSLGKRDDYIMGPIMAGMCRMESAKDGTLDLGDFALMNEALAIRAENQWRADEAARRQ